MLVNNKSDSPRYIGVYLQPGVNELNEKQVKKFLKVFENPTLQHILSDGNIEVVTKEDSEEEAAFSSLNADKAIALVKETTDLRLLEQFRKEETENGNRKTVLEAIDKQAASLATTDAEETEVLPEG